MLLEALRTMLAVTAITTLVLLLAGKAGTPGGGDGWLPSPYLPDLGPTCIAQPNLGSPPGAPYLGPPRAPYPTPTPTPA